MPRELILIAHNVRSTHNVGSLLRTAEGLGVKKVYLTGYAPYPVSTDDHRLPHLAQKMHKQIQKTALGAESLVAWSQQTDVLGLIKELKLAGYWMVALEQTPDAEAITSWKPPQKVAIIVGREVEGLEADVVNACDLTIEIPMFGQKESFNVVQAAAMALFYARFTNL
ncbi:MAG TPA: TrmH family RNA methyltransferase [Patescibacteria group bacterium]|nr:TrmH family RNA methyltransferase [Patescibacteria group bacterium]